MNGAKIKRPCVVLLTLTALCGAYISGVLLAGHNGGWTASHQGTGFLLRLCDPEHPKSPACSQLVSGRWGSFDVYVAGRRLLFPTSYFGMAYFLAMAIWIPTMLASDPRQPWIRAVTFIAVSGGLVVSIALVGVMGLLLRDWCPLCALAHGLNAIMGLGIIFVLLQSRRAPEALVSPSSLSDQMFDLRLRLAGLTVITVLIAAAGVWFYFDAMSEAQRQWRKARGFAGAIAELQSDPDFLLREFHARPAWEWPEESGQATGEPTADQVRITIFTDYDSGANACFQRKWDQVYQHLFGEHVVVEYRNRPSKLVPSILEGVSRAEFVDSPAMAAEAARIQGGDSAHHRMRELLFASRKQTPHRDYRRLALLAGLDVGRFEADMRSDPVMNRVVRDVELASKLAVEDSPAVFINGRRVPELCLQSPIFWNAVAYHVDSVTRGTPAPVALLTPTGHVTDTIDRKTHD